MAREEANPDAQRHQNIVAPPGKPLNNNYYRAGLGTLYEGIFACFRPVWGYFGRSNNDLVKSIEDDWEIPFEAITGLEWLGAGSQGAVFRGCLNGKTVAVKKVKLKEETDIKHLRHLDHPNIIKFLNLSLPIPETAPDGLKMLMRQCWSTTPRNRPSFTQCLKYMDILYAEFKEMGDEEFFRRAAKWRADAANIVYPATITKGDAQNFAEREDGHAHQQLTDYVAEKELIRKRREELKHAQDIREMYENKLKRTNKMYSKLTECMNELLLKEKELDHRLRMLDEQQRYPCMLASTSRNTVIRAGPRTLRGSEQDIYCTAVDPHSYGMEVSSSEEDIPEYHRGSPYRCSQASSSSGFPSSTSATFSRQSSQRSSAGMPRRRDSTLRESPSRGHHSPFSRSPYMRHSSSSQYCSELVRNSPARTSGMSEDSGVQMWNEPILMPGGQPVVYSQTLFRNVDGRWSDSRIVPAKEAKALDNIPASLETTARLIPLAYACGLGELLRLQQARSMIHDRGAQSPTPYDDPAELNVSNLPQSSSYQEALRQAGDLPSTSSDHRLSTLVEPQQSKVTGYTNPIYISPITSLDNPMSSPDSPQTPPPSVRKASGQMTNVDPNIDLFSSLDSNNPHAKTQTQSDASAENSTDDEKDEENGNILDSSLDSQKAFSALTKTSSEDDSSEKR
ncbi:hypothetical protein OESDEN_08882 [Oesophagostomum dentatum]|uniref:Protein kinase domain-containing protein n=1 Tax=Oesophagostomum dentatum TaxID=61180 RepID=A0A0B1T636_OESDE|nr:hypothetical protein OESDEN_08882 [Oesophagostomum dentatum]